MQSGPGQNCFYKLVSEPGSQISVNFLDMDMPYTTDLCSDYVQVIEEKVAPSSFIGNVGRIFCGQQLPNYPGPSVLISCMYSCKGKSFILIFF